MDKQNIHNNFHYKANYRLKISAVTNRINSHQNAKLKNMLLEIFSKTVRLKKNHLYLIAMKVILMNALNLTEIICQMNP